MNQNRIAHAFFALSLVACAGGDDADDGAGGGGKADDIGQNDSTSPAVDSMVFRVRPNADISDPGCQDCDAVGLGVAGLKIPPDIIGEVMVKAVVRHSNPDDVRLMLSLNSNGNFFDPEDDGYWFQGLTPEGHEADSPMQTFIAVAPDQEGCQTTAEHPDCFEIIAIAALGELPMRDSRFDDGDAATWDLEVMDFGLNGAKGQIRELTVVVLDPSGGAAN